MYHWFHLIKWIRRKGFILKKKIESFHKSVTFTLKTQCAAWDYKFKPPLVLQTLVSSSIIDPTQGDHSVSADMLQTTHPTLIATWPRDSNWGWMLQWRDSLQGQKSHSVHCNSCHCQVWTQSWYITSPLLHNRQYLPKNLQSILPNKNSFSKTVFLGTQTLTNGSYG